MKIGEILDFWREAVPAGWENTCDRLYYGTPDTDAEKIAVCFKLTVENLNAALAWGAQLIIPHEPLYPFYDGELHPGETNPAALALDERLRRSGAADW